MTGCDRVLGGEPYQIDHPQPCGPPSIPTCSIFAHGPVAVRVDHSVADAVGRLVEIDLPNGRRVRAVQSIPTTAVQRIIGALAQR